MVGGFPAGASPTCGWVRIFPHPSGDPGKKQVDSDDPTGSQNVAGGGVVPDATSGSGQERRSTPKGVPAIPDHSFLRPPLLPCDPSGVGLLSSGPPEVGLAPDAPATFCHGCRHGARTPRAPAFHPPADSSEMRPVGQGWQIWRCRPLKLNSRQGFAPDRSLTLTPSPSVPLGSVMLAVPWNGADGSAAV